MRARVFLCLLALATLAVATPTLAGDAAVNAIAPAALPVSTDSEPMIHPGEYYVIFDRTHGKPTLVVTMPQSLDAENDHWWDVHARWLALGRNTENPFGAALHAAQEELRTMQHPDYVTLTNWRLGAASDEGRMVREYLLEQGARVIEDHALPRLLFSTNVTKEQYYWVLARTQAQLRNPDASPEALFSYCPGSLVSLTRTHPLYRDFDTLMRDESSDFSTRYRNVHRAFAQCLGVPVLDGSGDVSVECQDNLDSDESRTEFLHQLLEDADILSALRAGDK